MDALADTIAGYILDETLGEGGFGRVFRAHKRGAERPVALKVARQPSSEARAAFAREIAILEHLATTGASAVNRIVAAGEHDGTPWLATELIEGTSLDEALAACGVARFASCDTVAAAQQLGHDPSLDPPSAALLTRKQLLPLVRDVAAATRQLHSLGVVHGDIKPQNILLDAQGVPVLIDFGSARRIVIDSRDAGFDGSHIHVTPRYSAPDDALSPTDPRADTYAIGCILYEVVWGQPFQGRFEAPRLDADRWPDRTTLELLSPWAEQLLEAERTRRTLRLDGLIDALDGAVGRAPEHVPEHISPWVPFAGRTAELAQLDERVAALKRGEGGLLGIVGERGVGKSRLMHELLQRAREEGCSVRPLEEQDHPTSDPTVLFADDLHDAPWSIQQKVLVLDESSAFAPRTLVLVGWTTPSTFPGLSVAHRLDLGGLSREASMTFARSLLPGEVSVELVDALYVRTLGNPERMRADLELWLRRGTAQRAQGAFHLLATTEQIAHKVAHAQAARLGELPAHLHSVLDVCRALGPELDVVELGWVFAERSDDAVRADIDELAAAGLLSRRSRDRYRLNERASQIAALPESRERRARIADRYERGLSSLKDAQRYATLGRLRARAEEHEAAFHAFRVATDLAQARRDRFLARVLLRMALGAAGSFSSETQLRLSTEIRTLREQLADALVRAGECDEGERLLGELLNGSDDRARILRKRGQALSQARRYEAAEQAFAEAERASELPQDRVALLIAQFWHYYNSRREMAALPSLAATLEQLVHEHGTTKQRCEYHQCIAAWRQLTGGYTEDAVAVEHARAALAAVDGDPSLADTRSSALFYLGFPLLWAGGQGAWPEAEQTLRDAVAACGDMEERSLACTAHIYHVVALRRLGEVERVERAAHQALFVAQQVGSPAYRGAALACLSWAAYRRERYEEARQLAARAFKLWQNGELRYPFQWLLCFPMAELHRMNGELQLARSALERLARDDQHRLPDVLLGKIRALRDAGDGLLHDALRATARVASQHHYL